MRYYKLYIIKKLTETSHTRDPRPERIAQVFRREGNGRTCAIAEKMCLLVLTSQHSFLKKDCYFLNE